MFSTGFIQELEQACQDKFTHLKGTRKAEQIQNQLAKAQGDVREGLLALYAAMPLSDMVDYSLETFLSYARHGAMLARENFYQVTIPEDVFAGYVLQHRINNEDIVKNREFFFDQVKDLIVPGDMEKTILDVNYWCASKVTYTTTDGRTANPMTVYNSGYGRCGEESTFAVSVFRSIGIPARQVYAPLWSHCDDNHAWVEVWCNGSWHYLGACEPEEMLDKGWFNRAATRAMMVHSQWLLPGVSDQFVGKRGMAYAVNQTERYARCAKITVKVEEAEHRPVRGAKVQFSVINYGCFGEIATTYTNDQGEVELTTGFGSLLVSVYHKGRYGEKLINTSTDREIVLLVNTILLDQEWQEFSFIAPDSFEGAVPKETKEMAEAGGKKRAHAKAQFKERLKRFAQEAKAFTFPEGFTKEQQEMLRGKLVLAGNNQAEILHFLLHETFSSKEKYQLLETLADKDFKDVTCEILSHTLQETVPRTSAIPEDIYVKYVMALRVDIEMLCAQRGFLARYLKEKEIPVDAFAIGNHFLTLLHSEPDLEYSNLITSAKGAISCGIASERSQKVIIVNALRSVGIPARLNPADQMVEAYVDGRFVPLEKKSAENSPCQRSSTLHLTKDKEDWLVYHQNITIAYYQAGEFRPLNLFSYGEEMPESTLHLFPGIYKILTASRLPNGSVLASQKVIRLEENEEQTIKLSLRKATPKQLLQFNHLENIVLSTDWQERVFLDQLIEQKPGLFLWLEEGMEPTEHILNELYDRKEMFTDPKMAIYFVVRQKEALDNPTIERTRKALPNVQVLYDDFDRQEDYLARRMYQEPGMYPLILLVNQKREAVYGVAGYNVGTADMILKLRDCL